MPLESWKPTQMAPRWDALQRDPEGFFNSIVEMMSSALRVPVSMISILQDDRHFVHSAHGLAHLQEDRLEIPIAHWTVSPEGAYSETGSP